MEYTNFIFEGFQVYDDVENALYDCGRTNNYYVDAKYDDGILTIEADSKNNKLTATIKISREEIIQMVISTDIEPKEAICKLLKERTALVANEISQ